MSRKNSGLSWVKKQEPKFIREFKERIAYKEQSSIETKKKKLESDLIIEKEEDRPQVVQLKAGDLGEKEYQELKDKEDIQNAASSFGRIIFKKPNKKNQEEPKEEEAVSQEKKPTEIDLIFNLNEKGQEEANTEQNEETEEIARKKVFLEDEEVKAGLQPPTKKRFIDRQQTKETNLTASKVLSREAKAGNKKLLSFYDEEQEEVEEFAKEDFRQKKEQEDKRREEQEDSD